MRLRVFVSLPVISAIAAVLLAAGTPCVSAAPTTYVSAPVITTVDDWDRVAEEMRRGVAAMVNTPALVPKDSRNRTPAQDYSDKVQTPEVTKQLETLREQARAQASKPKSVEKILAQVRTIYSTETYKINLRANEPGVGNESALNVASAIAFGGKSFGRSVACECRNGVTRSGVVPSPLLEAVAPNWNEPPGVHWHEGSAHSPHWRGNYLL
jgi:hypothetical protein